jgi:hypothetical protein
MNIINTKKVFFIILTSSLIILFLLYTISNSIQIKNPLYVNSEERISSSADIRNEDWEQMNAHVFFKRTGAFYIIEKQ